MRTVSIEWFDDPNDGAKKLELENRNLSPAERVAETVRLMELVSGWKKDTRIERVIQIISVPLRVNIGPPDCS